jgi:hypothetical protein
MTRIPFTIKEIRVIRKIRSNSCKKIRYGMARSTVGFSVLISF